LYQPNEPYFVAKDVATTLGYSNTRHAIITHCKATAVYSELEGGRETRLLSSLHPDTVFIPERDVYRLIMKSRLPEAEQFEEYVVSVVLPSIRKHGGYMTSQKIEEILNNPDTIIEMAQRIKREQEKSRLFEQKAIELEQVVIEQEPKVLFAKSVEASKTTILVGELAKILKQNGVEIGQNRLFEWLRTKGYLISRHGSDYNMPTQRSMELGLFEIKETAVTRPDGHIIVNKTVKVTGKGQVYFVDKFLGKRSLAT
jgi:anti-repressor protein